MMSQGGTVPAGSGDLMSLKKKVMAKKPTSGAARTSPSAGGSSVLLPKPKSHSQPSLLRKPKKPDIAIGTKEVASNKSQAADLILAVGTAFTAQQTASASSLVPGIPSSLESLWTLENEEDDTTTTCKYNYDQVAAAPQSLLLKNQDPFLPPTVKSPPPSSVSDLWSFEGVSNSGVEPQWDTEDPFQCINPYEAEGIHGFEKSKLSECSKVPIGEEASQLVDTKQRQDKINIEEKVEKNQEKREIEASYTEVKEETAEQDSASSLLTEIKSEPEPRDVEFDFEPIEVEEVEVPSSIEEQVLKAEFIYPEESASPEEMDNLDLLAVCDDSVPVEDFQQLLEDMKGIQPDPHFLQQAEQEYRAMTEPAPQNQHQMSLVSPQNQHQGSPASTLNCGDIRQINDMVDPALLDLLRQEQEQPAQPEVPVWPVNGGGVLILAPVEEPAPPEQPSEQEYRAMTEPAPQNQHQMSLVSPQNQLQGSPASPAKPDLLGVLVDQLLNVDQEMGEPSHSGAPAVPQSEQRTPPEHPLPLFLNIEEEMEPEQVQMQQPRSRRVRAAAASTVPRASHSSRAAKACPQSAERLVQSPEQSPLPLVSAPRAQRLSLKDPNARYDRMRTLNNAASQRCRENRKVKFQAMLDELREQEARNEELKLKYKLLVEAKDQAKKMFLQMIAQGARQ